MRHSKTTGPAADAGSAAGEVGSVAQQLAAWRRRYGGRGIPVPEQFWAQAARLARVQGVGPVARALRIDRQRLAARVGSGASDPTFVAVSIAAPDGAPTSTATTTAPVPYPTRVRFEAPDGARLDIEVAEGGSVDLAALAESFWKARR